jgi:hypothetical protein
MNDNLREVIARIAEDHKENIHADSRHYLEASIAQKADELGFPEVKERYKRVKVIVPLKHPVSGMKVRIDGRTFINYAQFESGIVVPNYVATQVNLPNRAYKAMDSMICNFA